MFIRNPKTKLPPHVKSYSCFREKSQNGKLTEEERTHTRILKTERELFFRNEISASIKFWTHFYEEGENAIFLIKHNTDYIHYTFIKKRKVYLKENA